MVQLTKKIAQLVSLFVFFTLLLVGIFSCEEFVLTSLPAIALKAFIGYVIFWLIGIVISDIILKAILQSMEDKKYEEWEGGLLVKFAPTKNDDLKKMNLQP
ncbi:MAG: hypothetical protein JNL74_23185 [Fibrobacteres bacterium]|nr:hypothetical protein [Fibrobacterota bacterium]